MTIEFPDWTKKDLKPGDLVILENHEELSEECIKCGIIPPIGSRGRVIEKHPFTILVDWGSAFPLFTVFLRNVEKITQDGYHSN